MILALSGQFPQPVFLFGLYFQKHAKGNLCDYIFFYFSEYLNGFCFSIGLYRLVFGYAFVGGYFLLFGCSIKRYLLIIYLYYICGYIWLLS